MPLSAFLRRDARPRVLSEALRVAGRVIIVDWISPLPWNPEGLAVRLIEWIGRHHYSHLKDYLAGGGINGVIGRLEGRVAVAHRAAVQRDCREIVAFSRVHISA